MPTGEDGLLIDAPASGRRSPVPDVETSVFITRPHVVKLLFCSSTDSKHGAH